MGRKRKYPEVKGWWLYTIKVPSINKYYIGVSKQQCSQRWCKSNYKGKSLAPYLNEWDSMIKTVLVDNLTKEEALKKEDALIQELRFKNLCINERRSGLIEVSDINAYQREHQKQYYENNKERILERKKQRYQNDAEYRERILEQHKQYRLKKKLEKQQNQLTLFDLAS